MFHIEFVGVPGAGKTTLKNGMIKRLRLKGQTCLDVEDALLSSLKKSRDDIITHFVFRILPDNVGAKFLNSLFIRSRCRFVAQNRFLSYKGTSLEVILKSEPFRLMSAEARELALSRFLRTAIEYQTIKEHIEEAAVVPFDEGFFQRGTSLFISPSPHRQALGAESVFPYFNAVPWPDLLILVEADHGECLNRIEARGQPGRLKQTKCSSATWFLAGCQEYVSHVLEWAKESGRPLLRVENNDLPQDVATVLSDKVFDKLTPE